MDDAREVDSDQPQDDISGHVMAVYQLAARLIPHLPIGFDQTAVIKLVTASLVLADEQAFRDFVASVLTLSKK